MTLYIVRHGETEWNKISKIQGTLDSPLTKKGIIQAESLGKFFKDKNIKFDFVFSSPLKRALDTARMISNNSNIIIKDEIKEISLGDLNGLTLEEVEKIGFKEEFEKLKNNPKNYDSSQWNGESLDEVINRTKNFLDYINLNFKDENILIVSHGFCLKVLFYHILGYDDINNMSKIEVLDNTSFSVVKNIYNKYEILDYSNTSHLNDELVSKNCFK